LTANEVHRSIIEKENGIQYAKIPPLGKDIGDYFLVGDDYVEPEPFTSSNTEQYDAKRTLKKIKEAHLL
jgi:hypothetical protein